MSKSPLDFRTTQRGIHRMGEIKTMVAAKIRDKDVIAYWLTLHNRLIGSTYRISDCSIASLSGLNEFRQVEFGDDEFDDGLQRSAVGASAVRAARVLIGCLKRVTAGAAKILRLHSDSPRFNLPILISGRHTRRGKTPLFFQTRRPH